MYLLRIICVTLIPFAAFAASESRLNDVAERGRHVMPFDLEATTHIFTKTPTGGIQQVRVKKPDNSHQIKLIRSHLQKIAAEFRQGDFSNPAKIHGDDMPGLQVLSQAQPGQLTINYKDLNDGAELDYITQNPELQKAVHDLFDAQLSDHARHAQQGPSMHELHHPQ